MIFIKKFLKDENDNKRSNYSIEEIVEMVTSWLDGLFLEPEGKKEERSFYVYMIKHAQKHFKLVFETRDEKIFIGVITLYRVAR